MAVPSRALLIDIGVTVAVAAIVTVAISVAGSGAQHADTRAYTMGLLLALPVLGWRRWPLGALVVSAVLMFAYYAVGNPGIPPSPVFAVPLYAAARAGRLRWAIGVPAFFYLLGMFDVAGREGRNPPLTVVAGTLPHIALAAVTILLGELVRSRRALAEETRERLRMADEEGELESARRVAEERVRIARELHDTVAHSMATISVQAGSVLHVLREREGDDRRDAVWSALTVIRETSRGALQELRATLGVLRNGAESDAYGSAGLDRLPALLDAVRAAGVSVTVEVTGMARPLDLPADHSAYRILQESLTNVLRHGGPEVRARVRMAYGVAGVAIEVTDDGGGVPAEGVKNGGYGLSGMRERAESVGGTLTAGPRPGGGFVVSAQLPVAAA